MAGTIVRGWILLCGPASSLLSHIVTPLRYDRDGGACISRGSVCHQISQTNVNLSGCFLCVHLIIRYAKFTYSKQTLFNIHINYLRTNIALGHVHTNAADACEATPPPPPGTIRPSSLFPLPEYSLVIQNVKPTMRDIKIWLQGAETALRH